MPATPSINIYERSSHLDLDSNSSSSKCEHGSGKNCEKPVSYGSLQIGLGIGIPAAVILIILGLFMLKNYRKGRKESMEHDPDFDENGDATALPDFPAFLKEDPFDNRYSIRPQSRQLGMSNQNRSNAEVLSMSTKDGLDRVMFDGFVLPYQHEIGSKASLEEFAKNSIDNNAPGSGGGRRNTMVPLFISSAVGSNRTSPQKSSLNLEHRPYRESKGPVGRLTHQDYKNLPNDSTTLLGDEDFYNTKEEFEEEDSHGTSKLSSNTFSVEYENEKHMPINEFASPQRAREGEQRPNARDSKDMPEPDLQSQEKNSIYNTGNLEGENDNLHDEPTQHTSIEESGEKKSPFEDNESETDRQDVTREQSDTFDESENSSSQLKPRPFMTKSPRMSAFNLLKNISDDEEDSEAADADNSADISSLNPDQAEELARMKSVYKVYFDRANSTRTVGTRDGNSHEFHADASQQLPSIDIDNLRINDNLKGDTQYDKRLTTTSSIYDENPIFHQPENPHHPYQQLRMPHQQQYQQYGYAQPPPSMQGPRPELPPLKTLPSASEIRRSTIETFTDYQPKTKPLPSGGQVVSPQMSSSGSFATLRSPITESMPPTLHEADENAGTPSPHQLSRTSVVMLNATNQINPKKGYKPAGSVPNVSRPGAYGYNPDELAGSHDDLIPGNRKSAVRRMMNSNF